jgi:CRISP-associated protein Cas1
MSWDNVIRPKKKYAMAWRSIIISKGATLRYGQNRLHIEQAETVSLPLEDIGVLVLDSPEILLTSRLLLECMEAGIVVLTVDLSHHPNGVMLPYLPHSRSLKTIEAQLAISLPQKKRAWQRVVQQKIRNQALCLAFMQNKRNTLLQALVKNVQSGDSGNVEAIAAQQYFPALFGEGFHRSRAIFTNAALNYGYAILRAAVARSLVAYGFITAVGLHHCSQLNRFNLADDILEPFRPVVDLYVAKQWPLPEDQELSPTNKSGLVNLLNHEVALDGEVMSALAAIDLCVQSLGRFFRKSNPALLQLPELLELKLHPYE